MFIRKICVLCFCLLYASFLSAYRLDLPKHVDATKWDKVAAYLKHINRKPENVSSLSLKGRGLQEIPGWVFDKVKNVKSIVLDENDIVSIPAAIGKLKRLQVFDASHNKILSVHADIQKATDSEGKFIGKKQIQELFGDKAKC